MNQCMQRAHPSNLPQCFCKVHLVVIHPTATGKNSETHCLLGGIMEHSQSQNLVKSHLEDRLCNLSHSP